MIFRLGHFSNASIVKIPARKTNILLGSGDQNPWKGQRTDAALRKIQGKTAIPKNG